MCPTDNGTSTASKSDARPREAVAPTPILYAVFDCERPAASPAAFELAQLDEVTIGRDSLKGARRAERSGRRLEVFCPDARMSAGHARLVRVLGRWILEDADSKNGVKVNGTVQRRAALSPGDVIELGRTFFLFGETVTPLEDAYRIGPESPALCTFDPQLAGQLESLRRIARSPLPVIVTGETGTGKELIARALHTLSCRAGEWVAVNCGALPESLAESELFGHRRGSFTGANEDRPGLVRASSGGTLFLDEIGDLPLALQAALLRVLQEAEVVPLGATKPVSVDLRVVCATHRDLPALVDERTFRGDLFARLSGLSIELPPLRQRREDLGLLVSALLPKIRSDISGISFSADAGRALFGYGWPLNVRELEKALQLAVTLSEGGRVELEHWPEAVRTGASPSSLGAHATSAGRAATLSGADAERREQLVGLMREHQGNISAVSRAMGVARMQVQRWLKRYAVSAESFRG